MMRGSRTGRDAGLGPATADAHTGIGAVPRRGASSRRRVLRPGALPAVCALAILAGGLMTAAPALAGPAPADASPPTGSGVRFQLPQAWTQSEARGAFTLRAPDGDPTVTILAAADAGDLSGAVGEALRAALKTALPKIDTVTPLAPDNGWEERRAVTFTADPADRRAVRGLALRRGSRWTVVVINATPGGAEKRLGAVNLITDSLLAPGYVPETLAGVTPRRLGPAEIGALRSFIRASLAELGAPGAAFALVDHGVVVAEEGVGVEDLRKPTPVTAQTLFLLGSTTKGMTTLLLSKLVDEGRISWNEPVTTAYPAFQLGSAETTRRVEVRHLVCACTGLPRKDLDWVLGTDRYTDASATFRLLAHTEPTSGFGEVFQYNNVMAAAAGFIGGHVLHPELSLGAAYDLAMQEKVFAPLGMTQTTFDYDLVLTRDHAWPHGVDVAGKPAPATSVAVYAAIRPAGAAWSSAHDMIKYVRNELDLGQAPDGRVLFSKANLLLRRQPNVTIGRGEAYGMGLATKDYGGVQVVHHGGSAGGFVSQIIAVPQAQIGAVILINAEQGGAMLAPFERRLIEVVYGAEPQAAQTVATSAARMKAMAAKSAARLRVPPRLEATRELASRYVSPDLGKIDVKWVGQDVVFDFGPFDSRVAEDDAPDGTKAFVTIDPGASGFRLTAHGEGSGRTLTIEAGQHAYVYTAR